MGYMRHHMIAVTCYDENLAKAAHKVAIDLGGIVTPIVSTTVNFYYSFFVAPDGSKEGWAASDNGDIMRSQFIRFLNTMRFKDGGSPIAWVEVQYGDEEGHTAIIAHSDDDSVIDAETIDAEATEQTLRLA